LYYFDQYHDELHIDIFLYVLDVANLQNDSCTMYIQGTSFSPPFADAGSNSATIQFVRYSMADHDDYKAYRFSYNYPNITSQKPLQIILLTSGHLSFDNNEIVNYNVVFPYYPTFQTYYDEGKDEGYSDGVNDRNAYWEDYIQETYESSTGSGYQRIFEDGRQAGFTQGQDSLNTMEWFETTASGVSSILQLKLLPSITIGALIFIPLMFFILKGVLWIWRRN
jgi:hypothetical protein